MNFKENFDKMIDGLDFVNIQNNMKALGIVWSEAVGTPSEIVIRHVCNNMFDSAMEFFDKVPSEDSCFVISEYLHIELYVVKSGFMKLWFFFENAMNNVE